MARINKETEKHISTLMSDNPKQMEKYKQIRGKGKSDRNGEVAWIIYYYLLSISHYSYEEEHRFVYKNEFNVSELSRQLDFSRTYFYTVLDKLKKQGLIKLNHDESAIIFPIFKSTSVQIDQEVFQALLGYAPRLGIDLLKTYLFLCIIAQKGSYKHFTKRNIVQCLGHRDTNQKAYQDVDLYLDLFDKWKLVFLRKEVKTDAHIGSFPVYFVEKLNKNSQYLEEQLKERKKESQNCFGLTENEIKEIDKLLNEE